LLSSRKFAVAAGGERVAENLRAHGAEIDEDAAAWVGATAPPANRPAIALGAHAATLGPHSIGFLNNLGRVAALDGPVPSLPRRGPLGLVLPTRAALPDVVPLCLARDLAVSFIISVGEGDPSEALRFLAADPETRGLAVVLPANARAAAVGAALGPKPAVVLGGDALCRAAARRAGAIVVDSLDEWLARAALLAAGVEPGMPASVVVVGGGSALVAAELTKAGLEAPLVECDDRDPAQVKAAVARQSGRAVLLVAGAPLAAMPARTVLGDPRQPEALRALVAALASPAVPPVSLPAAPIDGALLDKVHGDLAADPTAAITDHDLKRMLKAYGARVSRQAPTNTPTGAQKLARTIGLPVVLIGKDGERPAATLPEVRQLSTMLLAGESELPSLIVREAFPEAPRARLRIAPEPGLGLVAKAVVSGDGEDTVDAAALMPLDAADARRLAAACGVRRADAQRAVIELLARIAACIDAEHLRCELELFVGAEPAVVSGTASRIR
jgi:hypothetical protein